MDIQIFFIICKFKSQTAVQSLNSELIVENQKLLDERDKLKEEIGHLKTFLEKNNATLDELKFQVQKLKEKIEC